MGTLILSRLLRNNRFFRICCRSSVISRTGAFRYSSLAQASATAAGASMASSETLRVGWIGTGIMGQAMCGHLLSAGYQVTVFNRTPAKAQILCQNGAVMADSPSSVASRSNVVFTIVGFPQDVRQVILGEKGILQGLNPGGVVVDMTTSEPSLAKEIYSVAKEKGCNSVDAPVSGGDKGAKTGTLAIFAGGDKEVVEMLKPLFDCMVKVNYMGGPGLGQFAKLGNQITIATTMVGLVEGMLFAHKAGLDVEAYIKAIATGAAGSRSLDLQADRILRKDFDPGFFVNHFVKDLGIALKECQQMVLSLPGLALAQQLYVSLQAHGDGHLGTQALVLALERLNNLQLPRKE